MSERRVRQVGRPQYTRTDTRRARRGGTNRGLPAIPLRYILLVTTLVLILFGLYKAFAITKLVVVAPSRIPELTSEAMAAKEGSLKQGNLLTINRAEFTDKLKRSDPLILNVAIIRTWPHTLKVTIALKQPGIGWTTGNQSYLVDRDGTVIDSLSPALPIPVVLDDSNLPVKLGQRVVSTKFVEFVTNIAPKVNTLGLQLTKMEVKETTVDLYVTTNKGFQLIFDTTRSPEHQAENLKSVLALLATQKRTPAAYIDLRIADKAYYK